MESQKDKLTDAIMAAAVGLVFLLFRDHVGLLIESAGTWIGSWFRGPRQPGGAFLAVLFELVLVIFLMLFGIVCAGIVWVLGALNEIYALPVLVMLLVYATPWPFRLRFLNPRPYILAFCRFAWNMFILATYGEYLRRGRGGNVVFILLPLAGFMAIAVGIAGMMKQSPDGLRGLIPSELPSLSPRARVFFVDKIVATDRQAGVRLLKVIITPENTRLFFRFWTTGPPYTKVRLSDRAALSERSYLVDDRGIRYPVVSSEEMEFGQVHVLEPFQDIHGTLVFGPLDEKAQYIDLYFHSLETDAFWTAKQIKIR